MTTALTALSVERPTFPLVDCVACGTRGLTYLDYAGDLDTLRCLRCDAPVTALPTLAGRRAVESLGYVFIERAKTAPGAKRGGCGAKGVKSCGTDGCSSGSCGTGGCSSGGGCH